MPHASKSIWRFFNPLNSKLFRSRNIIVVSQGEVKHYPVSSKLQFFGITLVMGALSWGSYSTGSYFAAQTILAEKERKIETTTLLNRRIEEQYDLLKRDLNKLEDGKGELNEYDRFVVSQHKAELSESKLDDDAINNLSQSLLQDRIDYLEGLVAQLKTDRETLVSSIRERTKEQITAFEDIIENTGLKVARLTNSKQAKLKIKEIELADSGQSDVASQGVDFTNQGGPYVPENPTAAMLGLEEEEQGMVTDINDMMLLSDIMNAVPLATPMKDYRLSSPFGRRVDPITKRWALHKGLDFVGKYGEKVQATANGTVTFAARSGAYGNLVEIDHGYGITTRYAHLKKVLVSEGETVEKGTIVGLQGNSGRSTGSHVHYEVRFNRAAMNPKKFIEAGNNVF
jgi:murein DD-endopeptidase MepM/ murein hydrolase activator NlpD